MLENAQNWCALLKGKSVAKSWSARPAESQQHGGLGGLFLPFGLLYADHCVSEQGGWPQAARGVCSRPLRGKVCLDGGLHSL